MAKIKKHYHSSVITLLFCAGFVVGIFGGRVANIPFPHLVLLLFGIVLCALSIFIKNFIRILFAFAAGVIFGLGRISQLILDEQYIANYYNHTVDITGILAEDSELRDQQSRLKLNNIYLNYSTKHINCQLYAILSDQSEHGRSERIHLRGKLQQGFGEYCGFI